MNVKLRLSLQSPDGLPMETFGLQTQLGCFQAFQAAAAQGKRVVFLQVASGDAAWSQSMKDRIAEAIQEALEGSE